jgi:phenylalanyl-tRNA synthetase alpha chain
MDGIAELRAQYLARIGAAEGPEALEAVRLAALGKKGEISLRMRELGQMAPEARQQVAPAPP